MKHIYRLLPALLIVFASCSKNEVAELDFNVTVDQTSYKAGDTVRFQIIGNPELLTFYSGERGLQYENKGRTSADGKPELSFISYMQYGTQANTLKLLVSSDFSGAYNAAAIAAANWTDITSKAILSTGVDNTSSGIIDLSAYKSDKPIFFAYSFTGSTASTQRTWTIKNFAISNFLPDNSRVTVAGIADAGWVGINLNTSPRSWAITSTQLQFQGGVAGIGNNTGYVITKPLFLTKVSPDRGVALKNMATRINTYQYVYKESGD
uniref:DUF5017 domain-containing protein n=1 Tax=Pedobacter sp. TaxID=1411316 RepID=UPI003D7F270C